MEKERLTKLMDRMAFVIVAGVLLWAEVYGANPQANRRKVHSKNRFNETFNKVDQKFERTTVGPSAFTVNMPFGEAIDILRHSTRPPLNIVVLWRDLQENAKVYRDTPIGIEGVSGITLRKQLELLLAAVSANALAELAYTVDGGVIIIGTKDALPRRMVVHLYDVTDLVSAPANYFFPIGFGGPFMGFYRGQPGGMWRYGGYGGAYGGPYGFGRQYGLQGSYRRGRELSGLIGSFYRPNRSAGRRRR